MSKKLPICRVISIFIITVIIASTFPYGVYAADTSFDLDLSNTSNGYITVKADRYVTDSYKITVSANNKSYSYNFKGSEQSYPLQLGNGQYDITLQKLSYSNYYVIQDEWQVNVLLKNTTSTFLVKNSIVNWDAGSEVIKQAAVLVKNLKNDSDKVNAIHKYIVENFKYDAKKANSLKNNYTPDINVIFSEKSGLCYDFATLNAAMLRSIGIPAKLVMGNSKNINGYHAWNEVYVAGKWIVVDTSYDAQAKAAKVAYNVEKGSSSYSNQKEY